MCGTSYHLRQTMISSVVRFIFYRALIALPGGIIFKFITCHNVCSQAVLQKYHLSSRQILLLHTLSCKTCRKGKHDVTIFSGSVFYRMFCNEQNIFLSLFSKLLKQIIQNYSKTLLKSNSEIYIVKRDNLL